MRYDEEVKKNPTVQGFIAAQIEQMEKNLFTLNEQITILETKAAGVTIITDAPKASPKVTGVEQQHSKLGQILVEFNENIARLRYRVSDIADNIEL